MTRLLVVIVLSSLIAAPVARAADPAAGTSMGGCPQGYVAFDKQTGGGGAPAYLQGEAVAASGVITNIDAGVSEVSLRWGSADGPELGRASVDANGSWQGLSFAVPEGIADGPAYVYYVAEDRNGVMLPGLPYPFAIRVGAPVVAVAREVTPYSPAPVAAASRKASPARAGQPARSTPARSAPARRGVSRPTTAAARPAPTPRSTPSPDAAAPAVGTRSTPSADAAAPAATPRSAPSADAAAPAATPRSAPSADVSPPVVAASRPAVARRISQPVVRAVDPVRRDASPDRREGRSTSPATREFPAPAGRSAPRSPEVAAAPGTAGGRSAGGDGDDGGSAALAALALLLAVATGAGVLRRRRDGDGRRAVSAVVRPEGRLEAGPQLARPAEAEPAAACPIEAELQDMINEHRRDAGSARDEVSLR